MAWPATPPAASAVAPPMSLPLWRCPSESLGRSQGSSFVGLAIFSKKDLAQATASFSNSILFTSSKNELHISSLSAPEGCHGSQRVGQHDLRWPRDEARGAGESPLRVGVRDERRADVGRSLLCRAAAQARAEWEGGGEEVLHGVR